MCCALFQPTLRRASRVRRRPLCALNELRELNELRGDSGDSGWGTTATLWAGAGGSLTLMLAALVLLVRQRVVRPRGGGAEGGAHPGAVGVASSATSPAGVLHIGLVSK